MLLTTPAIVGFAIERRINVTLSLTDLILSRNSVLQSIGDCFVSCASREGERVHFDELLSGVSSYLNSLSLARDLISAATYIP